jgi:hypothetical protein
MDGHSVLIVVGNKAWYHWSASRAVVDGSQGGRSYAPCDVRALSSYHMVVKPREGWNLWFLVLSSLCSRSLFLVVGTCL